MMAWSDILAEAIAASGQPGDLTAPTTLLELTNSLANPLAMLSGRDTEHEVFATLDEDLGFVRVIRSSRLAISADQKEKLTSSIRWLIGMLSGWQQTDDPKAATLVTMIAVAARLDENGALWSLMPNKITQNQGLAQELQRILGRLQFRIEAAKFSRSPLVDREQITEFATAEAEKNWPALRPFAENVPWRFQSNAILDQSARLLNRFFPDRLAEVGQTISQIGIAMQMMTAISIGDAFQIATQSENDFLQFASVCRLFGMYDRAPALDAKQEDALVALLNFVSTDTPRWLSWMVAFAAHPYQTSQIQPALGRCLAFSDEAALRAYIDAICIQSSWLGRDDVKTCLSTFAKYSPLEKRKTAWNMAFIRWSDWNFGERDGHSALTDITLSNIDFPIVGYAVECLTPEERETHIASCLDLVERAEHVWHKSQLHFMHYIYRALSRSQPFLRARNCGLNTDNWLWDKDGKYFFDRFDDPYWRLRYSLHNMPNRQSSQ
nr:hypothetical protein [uncultured Acidocella sp.]